MAGCIYNSNFSSNPFGLLTEAIMKCKFCYQEYDPKERAKELYRRRCENAKRSARKAMESGNHWNIGRNRKLTNEQHEEIREKYKPGWNKPSMSKLASEYGVSRTVIHRIVHNLYK